MDHMETIRQMLTGQMDMKTFIGILKTDAKLQDTVRSLLPREAIVNPDHPYWKKWNYESYQKLDFDLMRLIHRDCRLDGSLGDNLNLFADIKYAYCFSDESLVCTANYREAYDFYLDVIRECFEGPEVDHIVEEIVREFVPMKPKSKRIKLAKEKVNAVFHVVDRKYPRWIQGPCWPMGKNSPMQYVDRKRIHDGTDGGAEFIFRDVDTDELRSVVQYY